MNHFFGVAPIIINQYEPQNVAIDTIWMINLNKYYVNVQYQPQVHFKIICDQVEDELLDNEEIYQNWFFLRQVVSHFPTRMKQILFQEEQIIPEAAYRWWLNSPSNAEYLVKICRRFLYLNCQRFIHDFHVFPDMDEIMDFARMVMFFGEFWEEFLRPTLEEYREDIIREAHIFTEAAYEEVIDTFRLAMERDYIVDQ
jgi:hypothetical protein